MQNRRFYYPLFILISLICLNNYTFAATIYVPRDEPTIQSGIDRAKNGDMVLVASGTYKGEGNVNIDLRGKEITVKSESGPDSTTINCLRTPETRGFIFQNQETNSTLLEGFTILNGIHDLGGGIYINDASPTIKNCVISHNKATARRFHAEGGGGIYMFNSEAIIVDCLILHNTAESNRGAGIFIEGDLIKNGTVLRETKAEPSIRNSEIIGNSGSGIFTFESVNPNIQNCNISQNTGRGIEYNSFARTNIPITDCTITQNTSGGVKVSEHSVLKITNSIIKHNTASEGAGIYCSPTSVLYASDCIIVENIAQKNGGGIAVASTFGNAEISNCTITRNTANERGGGVYAFIEGSSFDFTDSIVWGNNSNGTHDEFSAIGGWITIKSCDIRDGLDGIGREADAERFTYQNNIDKDPLFVDPDRGDYSLKQNSPAIDMGANIARDGVMNVSSIGKRLITWGELKRR